MLEMTVSVLDYGRSFLDCGRDCVLKYFLFKIIFEIKLKGITDLIRCIINKFGMLMFASTTLHRNLRDAGHCLATKFGNRADYIKTLTCLFVIKYFFLESSFYRKLIIF